MTNSSQSKAGRKAIKYINLAFIIIISIMLIQIAVNILITYYLKGVLILDSSVKAYLLVMVAQTLAYILCRYIVLKVDSSKSDSSKTAN